MELNFCHHFASINILNDDDSLLLRLLTCLGGLPLSVRLVVADVQATGSQAVLNSLCSALGSGELWRREGSLVLVC